MSRRLRRRLWPMVVATLAVAVGRSAAQVPGSWLPGERVLIGDFTTVAGLASDRFRIYAATLHGLLTWDPARQEWGPPLTFANGYPVGERPSALAWSAGEQALVLGTRLGRLWRLDPIAGRAVPLAAVPGPVEALLAAEAGDLYVRTTSSWLVIPAGSMVPRPGSPPAELREQGDERLRSLAGVLGLDRGLRRWPITAVTAGLRPDEYYVGTAGGGLLLVDARTLRVTPLPYGGTGSAVTAIAQVGETLWFGTRQSEHGRSSVFSADTSLRRWHWPEPQREGAPTGGVTALAALGASIWAGGEEGLFRLSRNAARWERFDARDGLPSTAVTALVAADSVLWVGTRRGACLWHGESCGPALLPGGEVTALSRCGTSLWIGTRQGLWEATAAGLARTSPPGFSGPVRGLACHRGTLYLAGPRQLLVRGPDGWRGPLAIGGSGTVHAVVSAEDGVWVGGSGGVARWDPAATEWLTYLVPHDIPVGPVLTALPTGGQVWLATPAGALRLELRRR